MATVYGNLLEIVGTPGNRQVTFRSLVNVVFVGDALVVPGVTTTRSNGAGYFSLWLAHGLYEMVCGSAKVKILVPDDANSYNFVTLLTDDVTLLPESGGAPDASPTVKGLVKIDEAGNGVAVTGFLVVADATALRAVAFAANNKCAILRNPSGGGRIYLFDNADNATAEDDPSVIEPTDGLGRWFLVL